MKKQRSEDKGITLVALVVTIIVLIILAGVTLNIVLDNDGIINKTKEGAKEYENAQKEEQELLGEIEGYIEYAGKTAKIPEGYTKSQITTEDDVAEGLVIYEIPEGATVNWTDEEDENGNNQSTITIGDTTTNLQETINQYVWIPVEDINSMVMCSSNTDDSICNLKYDEETNILACANSEHSDTATDLVGRLYTGVLTEIEERSNTIYVYSMDFSKNNNGQMYYPESGYREPADLIHSTNADASSKGIDWIKNILGNETLNLYEDIRNDWIKFLKEDFKDMAKSIAKNGGFYISRYEVGENGESKKGQKVLTADNPVNVTEGDVYLGVDTWYGLYKEIRNKDSHKQMIWGCQFDQVIKFIGEDAQIGHSDRNLTEIKALSGQNNLDKMKNVYDLEGNFYEWTLEADSSDHRVRRGNDFERVENNYFYPISYRGISFPVNQYDTVSSRVTLYL